MFISLTIENFKSYDRATLPLRPLTVLVGANASGKSNAIEALKLLAWLAHGRKLNLLPHDKELGLRGRPGELFRDVAKPMKFSLNLGDRTWGAWQTELALRDGAAMHITDERVVEGLDPISTKPLYEVVALPVKGSSDLTVAYNNFKPGSNKAQIACHDQQSVFTQLTTSARFGEKHTKSQQDIPKVCRQLESDLQNILFLDPIPSQMRGYSATDETVLRPDGSNLSAMLSRLVKQEQTDSVMAFIRSLPEQDIQKLEFDTTSRNEVMVKLVESFGGNSSAVEAVRLSDGTLRVLAIAVALLTAKIGSLVVIEELDNGIHPSRAKQLMAAIRASAVERKLTILISTHNPALIDAVPNECMEDVVFCHRDTATGASRLVSLRELKHLPELIAQGSLGQLVTQGILDRFVKNPETDEQRQAKATEWLKSLEGGAQ